MEGLPLLVLETICEHLTQYEPQRQSLFAFVSTSKACCAAAARERFSRMILRAYDEERCQRSLERLEHLLESTGSRNLVRVLKIGEEKGQQEDGQDVGEGAGPEDPFSHFPKAHVEFHAGGKYKAWTPTNATRGDASWTPLANFISRLALKDLIWASREQVPQCVLSVLHEKKSNCRLHVHVFDLRSLHQEDDLKDIDEGEYNLATSQCLYSIIAPYCAYDITGRANYNEEAILLMAAGCAPNLKHVRVWENTPIASGELRRGRRRVRLPWRGFHPQSKSEWPEIPALKGHLDSLRIDPGSHVNDAQLAMWETHTEFSHLRSIKIGREINLVALQKLANIAEYGTFRRLRTLSLPIVSPLGEDFNEVDSAMQRLLSSVYPLEELSLTGIRTIPYGRVLERHGATLKTLRIVDHTLSCVNVCALVKLCPDIRELDIEILRTAGRSTEVEIYRTLGHMRSLEKLGLQLHCARIIPRTDGDPGGLIFNMEAHSQQEERKEMEIAMRRVLINAAMDNDLANEVFQEILGAHATMRESLPPRLSLIKLEMVGVSELNRQRLEHDFQCVLRWIGRNWICRRDPRDTHLDKIYVEESGKADRVKSSEWLDDDMEELYGSELYGKVWEELWPQTGAGWKEDWRSFPLERDEDKLPVHYKF